jgi:cell division protein FtsL
MFQSLNLEDRPWFRKKIIGLILLIVAGVVVLEIWMVNRLATFGEQLSKLEEIKGSLITENELLENEIAEKSSLIHLGDKAKEEGFGPIKALKYVKETEKDIALGQ